MTRARAQRSVPEQGRVSRGAEPGSAPQQEQLSLRTPRPRAEVSEQRTSGSTSPGWGPFRDLPSSAGDVT